MSVSANVIAFGEGWRVQDVICTHGPQDRPFEEQHGSVSIAAVTAGTFQYRTQAGAATLVPGALLLGNHGTCFECGHAHGAGDRCLAFHFTPAFFEAVAADVPGARRVEFTVASVPPIQAMLPLLAEAEAARDSGDGEAFAELALRLAGATLALQTAARSSAAPSARDERRITAAVRRIAADPQAPFTVSALARAANMSAYHFLRTFRRVAGITPHQYLLRARLMRAAVRLRLRDEAVSTIAYDAGFNDLSTFNRRFRRLIGVTPGAFRARRR